MSDADRVALRYVEEETFGTSPSGSVLNKTTVQVIAADDSYNDSVEDLSVLTPGQTILVSGFTETANNGYKTVVTSPDRPSGSLSAKTTVSVSDVDDSYNDATEDLSVFTAGQKILVSGFTEAANNGVKNVVSATANKMIVSESLTTEVAGDTVTILSVSYVTVQEALADEAVGDTVSFLTAYNELRHTGESLKQDTTTQESNEIRDDRQVADVKRSSVSASGDINFELSYGAFDDFIAAALMSSGWSTQVSDTQITFAAVTSGNKFTDSGSGFVTAGFVANQWIEVRGFTTAANNGYFKIVSVIAGEMVVTGGTLVDEVAGDSVTIKMGPQVVNGVASRYFSIEREYSDLSSIFALFNGMMVNQMVLNVAAEQIITGTFSLMGKTEDSATSSTGTGTPNAAPINDVVNAVDDVLSILENLTDTDANSLSITVNNNLRLRTEIGELGPADIGAGRVSVSGTVQMYFETVAIMDKYLDQTQSSIAFIIEDGAGNVYIIDLPRIMYTSGARVAGGPNTDVIADMAFNAHRHATEDVTVRICRFAA
jgi:hypothetical protein